MGFTLQVKTYCNFSESKNKTSQCHLLDYSEKLGRYSIYPKFRQSL